MIFFKKNMKREEMLRRLERGDDPLDLSIQKWQDIVDCLQKIRSVREFDEDLERGGDNCALCETFPDCTGCPVYEKTGCTDCAKTEYYRFRLAWRRADLWTMRDAAEKELNFLRNLQHELIYGSPKVCGENLAKNEKGEK